MADPVTLVLATAVVTGVASTISEAATEATGAALKALRASVFAWFRASPDTQAVLDEALLEPEEPRALEAVAQALERAEREDPGIRELLRELRPQVAQAGHGAVHNSVSGDVSGSARVVQGRDFHGDIHL